MDLKREFTESFSNAKLDSQVLFFLSLLQASVSSLSEQQTRTENFLLYTLLEKMNRNVRHRIRNVRQSWERVPGIENRGLSESLTTEMRKFPPTSTYPNIQPLPTGLLEYAPVKRSEIHLWEDRTPAIDWMFVSLHNSNSKPSEMVFVGGTFGSWLGHEGMNGISALIKKTKRVPLPLSPCENTVRSQSFMNQEVGLH